MAQIFVSPVFNNDQMVITKSTDKRAEPIFTELTAFLIHSTGHSLNTSTQFRTFQDCIGLFVHTRIKSSACIIHGLGTGFIILVLK
ncbi:hypothetical protein CHS0354_007287, partial [Potamilus streckersoni]